jgi:hypothetical protein
MSERNGDRARFQKNRKRKLLHRKSIAKLVTILRERQNASVAPGHAKPTANIVDL